jgi:hypothetical protein
MNIKLFLKLFSKNILIGLSALIILALISSGPVVNALKKGPGAALAVDQIFDNGVYFDEPVAIIPNDVYYDEPVAIAPNNIYYDEPVAIVPNNIYYDEPVAITPNIYPTQQPIRYPIQYPSYPSQGSIQYPMQYPSYPTQYPSYPTQYPSYPTQYPTQYPSYPTQYPSSQPTSNVVNPSFEFDNNLDSYNNLESYNDNANSNSNSNSNDLSNDNYNNNESYNENYNDNYSNSNSEANSYSDSYSESNSEAYSDSYSNSESNADANVNVDLNNEINLDNINEQSQNQDIVINFMRALGQGSGYEATGSASYDYSYTDSTGSTYREVDQPRYTDNSGYYSGYNSQLGTTTPQIPNYMVQQPYAATGYGQTLASGGQQSTNSAQPKVITTDGGAVTKELPKTGLPFAAAALAGLFPVGFKLRKMGKKDSLENSANYIWESRELGKD